LVFRAVAGNELDEAAFVVGALGRQIKDAVERVEFAGDEIFPWSRFGHPAKMLNQLAKVCTICADFEALTRIGPVIIVPRTF
jgi:hypothetical protein